MSAFDGIGVHQSCIDNALVQLTWYQDVCRGLGMDGISQVWIDPPGWYIWLEQDGTFLLRLLEVEHWRGRAFGSYLLHRFPSPEEVDRISCSAAEKDLLEAPFFDPGTGTPKFEYYSAFSDAFVRGEIGLVLSESGKPGFAFSHSLGPDDALLSRFLDFLISILAFAWATAPSHGCKGRSETGAPDRFEIFGLPLFTEFANDYGFRDNLHALSAYGPDGAWKRLAQTDKKSHLSGTCSCSH